MSTAILRQVSPRAFFTMALLGACMLPGLILAVNWKWAVAFTFLIIGYTVNLHSVRMALLPVFFFIPFDRLGKLGPDSWITVAKVFIATLIMAWVTKILLQRDDRPLHRLMHSPLFALALLSLVFSFVSIVNAKDVEYFLGQNIRRVSNVVLFVVISTVIDRKIWIRRCLYVFLLAYVFVVMTAIWELQSGHSILETVWGEEDTELEYTLESGSFRIGGPGGDPDFLACSMLFPSMIASFFLFEPIRRSIKAAIFVLLLFLVMVLMATSSRGGLLALIIGASVFWLLTRMRYKFLVPVLAGILMGGILLVLTFGTGAASAERYSGQAGASSIYYRIGWTKMAVMMIQDHPWVGVGTGNFPIRYNRYRTTVPEVERGRHWSHNSFLQSWAETGIGAFLVYVGLFLTSGLMLLRVIRNSVQESTYRLAVMLLSTLSAYFFFAGTSNVLENENYWIVWALTAVVFDIFRREQAGGEIEPEVGDIPTAENPAPAPAR